MSETTELLDTPKAPARRGKGEGLSGMVLTELKALAGELGIKGTSAMRKGDLVAAISARQGGQHASAAPRSSQPTLTDALGGATSDVASTTNALTPTRQREAPGDDQDGERAGLASSPPARGAAVKDTAAQGTAPQAGDRQPGMSQDGESPAAEGPPDDRRGRRNRRDRDGESDNPTRAGTAGTVNGEANGAAHTQQVRDRTDQDNRVDQRGGRDGGTRGGQSQRERREDNQRDGRDNNHRPARDDRDTQRNNQRDGREDSREDRRDGRNGQAGDRDDESDGRGRRGRRYRDRNRRNRDRFGESSGETELREDDVLVPVAGILDVLDSYAFIRTSGYLSGPNDVYVSLSQVRKYGLRRGDAVTGAVRQPREGEQQRQKFNALVRLDSVNGQDPDNSKDRPEFTKLTPLYPNERLRLETESHLLTTRVIDLVMPVGKGQRALIVSPPKAGKTSVLQAIANAITTNNPEVHLMVVLVDERPEEVTDMQRSVKGEVVASTFDRPPSDHTMVAELSIERAKRLVEMGKDVVVLLDSITRLGRAYNLAAPASGRILSGGVDSTALFPPKRFLGAARNIENGGSLTIFASALVETGSAGDTVIFEEFKGTGNAELKLDRKLADKRIFPAIDVDQSSTRKEELLLAPDELAVTVKLRRLLSALDAQQSLELVLDRLRKTRNNVEFLMQVAKNMPMAD